MTTAKGAAMAFQYFTDEDRDGESEQVRAWMDGQQRTDDQAASAANAWDSYFRGLLENERRLVLDVVAELVRETADNLWRDIETEVKKYVRLAFLERGGGLTPRVREVWRADEPYERLDIVARNGAMWIARVSNPAGEPGAGSSDWALMSQKGRKGDQGEPGPRGEAGPRGAAGADMEGWLLDPDGYTATPLMRDGSRGPPLRLRELFQKFYDELHGVAVVDDRKAKRAAKASPNPPPPALVRIVALDTEETLGASE